MSRIDLQVPYAERIQAKAAGAKWDPNARIWYTQRPHGGLGYHLPELAKWARQEDRRHLECRPQHEEVALMRGASRDPGSGRLFVPGWYAQPGKTAELLYRLPYWLPECPEFWRPGHGAYRVGFSSHAEAARFIAVNSPYTPRAMYFPEERDAMDRLCAVGGGWYICDPKQPYYRNRAWDDYD